MKLTIQRGAKEIGGSCVELQSGTSKILIDFGLPLVDENKERFNSEIVKTIPKTELIKNGVLPDITGLYKDENPAYDGILLSHSHQDHYGLLSFVSPQVPVYLSEGCKELLDVSYFFGQTTFAPTNTVTLEKWKPCRVGAFTVTPYLVDHSAFDALAFLIEAEGKRVFYSGDFRGHGRKSVLFQKMLRDPPKNVTCLILEGSMLGRSKGLYQSEQEVEDKLVELLTNQERLYFMACSSQNIDRLVSIYKACKRSNRVFVIDPYTAYILDKLKGISANIPQYNWGKNIRVFFVPNTYTERMADNKKLFKFKSAKITYEQMKELRKKLVVKDTDLTRKIFSRKKDLVNTTLIYSLWSGYLPEIRFLWDSDNVPIVEVHCSGHIYTENMQEFAKAIAPEFTVPIHTFFPERYSEFLRSEVRVVGDRETVDI
ncbi:MAG: hypothetical protein JW720_00540 [Sedimentisphaerales bacterium]|nr:hypothetical protein [Sedimentisphaerales bacterium]